MGVVQDNSGGTFVPEPTNLSDNIYTAEVSEITTSEREYEDDTSYRVNLLFKVNGETVAYSTSAKATYNPEYGTNSELFDTLRKMGLAEAFLEVMEAELGVDGQVANFKNEKRAGYDAESEEEAETLASLLMAVFAGRDLDVLVETYKYEISEDQAKESDDLEAGQDIDRATVDKIMGISAEKAEEE